MKLWLIGLVLVPLAIAAASPPRSLRGFELTDQNSVLCKYSFPKAKVTAMTVADRKGSEQLEPWITKLSHRYGKQIDIDGVADVSTVPAPLREVIREMFRKRLAYPVMLDWDGSVVKQFGYQRGVANIYVIDRRGCILKQITGPAHVRLEQELYQVIDRAIADGIK